MNDKKEDVISRALDVYMKYGIKSVTMDEMARQLGVSKKTLYSYVSDKNELVKECLLYGHAQDLEVVIQISEAKTNAIEQMLEITRFVLGQLKKVHPSIFFDLNKYHPMAMKLMHDYKYDFILGYVISNLKSGIEQGLYRENINVDIISKIYLANIDHVMTGDIFDDNGYRTDQIYSEFFRYHIRGIASEKGLEYLVELIKNDENL